MPFIEQNAVYIANATLPGIENEESITTAGCTCGWRAWNAVFTTARLHLISSKGFTAAEKFVGGGAGFAIHSRHREPFEALSAPIRASPRQIRSQNEALVLAGCCNLLAAPTCNTSRPMGGVACRCHAAHGGRDGVTVHGGATQAGLHTKKNGQIKHPPGTSCHGSQQWEECNEIIIKGPREDRDALNLESRNSDSCATECE